jgi:hypothetical protein
MHIRPKTYLQVISQLRGLRVLLSRRNASADRRASPLLVYVAVVLALLLAILQIDLHTAELQSLGLLGKHMAIDPIFFSP